MLLKLNWPAPVFVYVRSKSEEFLINFKVFNLYYFREIIKKKTLAFGLLLNFCFRLKHCNNFISFILLPEIS